MTDSTSPSSEPGRSDDAGQAYHPTQSYEPVQPNPTSSGTPAYGHGAVYGGDPAYGHGAAYGGEPAYSGPPTYGYDPTGQYPAYPAYQPYQPYSGQPFPPAPAAKSGRTRNVLFGFGSGVVAAALVVGGIALASPGSSPLAGSGSLTQTDPTTPGGLVPSTVPSNPGQIVPGGGTIGGGTTGGTTTGGTTASAKQQVGIVTIVSTLKYQNAQSAGTGMVVSSDGEILTNNHVINGATSITVTVESTGRSYRAAVVGTDPTDDIAVLKLQDASGLATAAFAADAKNVSVGDAVTGVGNAGGTGTLTAASGKVTALDQSITASDESGASSERLTGLIEIDAPIISGDSGGPLYDAAGKIVGIDTAASASRTATSSAYAITIDHAKQIADQIEAGVETTSIHLGLPGFLGVSTEAANGTGAGVAQLLPDGPASAAGITAGSVITAVNGTAVTSPESLRSVLRGKDPGTKVKITWIDASNGKHTATVTLATGPAD